MKSSIVNIDNSFFFIVDKENGEVKRIEIDKDKGIIKQLNDVIDTYEKERL